MTRRVLLDVFPNDDPEAIGAAQRSFWRSQN